MSDKKTNQYNVINDIKTIDPNKILYIAMEDGNIYVLNSKDQQNKKSSLTTRNHPIFKKNKNFNSEKLLNTHFKQNTNIENETTFQKKKAYKKIINTKKIFNSYRKFSPENLTINREKYCINKKPNQYKRSNFSKSNYFIYKNGESSIKNNSKIQVKIEYKKKPSNKLDDISKKSKITNQKIKIIPILKIMNSFLYPNEKCHRKKNNTNLINQNEIREKTNILSERKNYNFFERKVIHHSPTKTPEKYYYIQKSYAFLSEEKKPYMIPIKKLTKNNSYFISRRNNFNLNCNINNTKGAKINFKRKNDQNIPNINNIDMKKGTNTERKAKKEVSFKKVVIFGENENNEVKNSKKHEIKGSLNKINYVDKGRKL